MSTISTTVHGSIITRAWMWLYADIALISAVFATTAEMLAGMIWLIMVLL